jgi:hypothetical protein
MKCITFWVVQLCVLRFCPRCMLLETFWKFQNLSSEQIRYVVETCFTVRPICPTETWRFMYRIRFTKKNVCRVKCVLGLPTRFCVSLLQCVVSVVQMPNFWCLTTCRFVSWQERLKMAVTLSSEMSQYQPVNLLGVKTHQILWSVPQWTPD